MDANSIDEKTIKGIKDDFQIGISPLGLALKYKVEVDQVYEVIGQPQMNQIQYGGDMIDPEPLVKLNGPTINKIRYSKD